MRIHASFFKLFPFFLPDFLGKFEIRDAVHEQSARGGLGFEDRYIIAFLDEHIRAPEACRSCTDHGNALVFWFAYRDVVPASAAFIVYCKGFQFTA